MHGHIPRHPPFLSFSRKESEQSGSLVSVILLVDHLKKHIFYRLSSDEVLPFPWVLSLYGETTVTHTHPATTLPLTVAHHNVFKGT